MRRKDVYWWRPLDDTELDTRGQILFAAYKEIHVNGFQSASLSNILKRTGVTKGALYHHFRDKSELGYAVVDEVIDTRIQQSFIHPLTHFDDPIEGFIELIQNAGETFSMTDIELGCPLSVLAQEMAPIDEGFRTRLTRIYQQWHTSIAAVLARGKAEGLIIDRRGRARNDGGHDRGAHGGQPERGQGSAEPGYALPLRPGTDTNFATD
jgi:AcrR family transcriptional regulator